MHILHDSQFTVYGTFSFHRSIKHIVATKYIYHINQNGTWETWAYTISVDHHSMNIFP